LFFVPDDQCLDSNFAAMIFPNGSVLGVGRGSVYTADKWDNVSSYTARSAAGMYGEDPTIWIDDVLDDENETATSARAAASGVLHMLRHTARNVSGVENNGKHFFSEDSGLRFVQSVYMYRPEVRTISTMYSREGILKLIVGSGVSGFAAGSPLLCTHYTPTIHSAGSPSMSSPTPAG
jgi:hypothetical protein